MTALCMISGEKKTRDKVGTESGREDNKGSRGEKSITEKFRETQEEAAPGEENTILPNMLLYI